LSYPLHKQTDEQTNGRENITPPEVAEDYCETKNLYGRYFIRLVTFRRLQERKKQIFALVVILSVC